MGDGYISDWLRDGERIALHYQERIRKHDLGAKALDWRSEEEGKRFFREGLTGVDVATVRTVFDVGCGKADLYPFMLGQGYKLAAYAGIDVVPEFVERARSDYQTINVRTGNFITFNPAGARFDLVANFGGLNSRMSHHEAYLEYVIGKMAGMSARYVAFNVLADAEPGFFPKGNQHTIGHITDIASDSLRGIVTNVSRSQGFKERIRTVQIFPKCHDVFVVMEKRL